MSAPGELLQIGQVAARAGVSLRTVRWYEEMGLLEPEDRTEGGFRLYTVRHVERLAAIAAMKPLGFTVREIRDVLEAADVLDGDPSAADRAAARARLRDHARATDARVAALRAQLDDAERFADGLRRRARRRR